jgi:hypothetical protein
MYSCSHGAIKGGNAMATTGRPEGILPFSDFRQKMLAALPEHFRGQVHVKVKNRTAFREMKNHLAGIYDGVEAQHSFVDENGQIFDCIPFEQQQAVKNSLKSGNPIPTPPPAPMPPGGYARPPAAVLEPMRARIALATPSNARQERCRSGA